jgi:hypothetical protein
LTDALQEVALARVVRAGDCRQVGRRRFVVPANAPEQVGADRVEKVIALEIEAVEESERRIRPFDLCHGNRAVEGHDRAWRDRQELISGFKVKDHDWKSNRHVS